MLVEIDNEQALDILMDRVAFWTDDTEVKALYNKMYENMIDGGVFDHGDFDVNAIVDNDYINYTRVVSKGDDEYDELLKVYKDNDCCCGDVSCDTTICDYIEAVDNEEEPTMFLIRM